MIALDILSDGFFAAIAAMGFGAIADPPLRAFKMIAILSAIGHASRFCLMSYAGVDIASATFVGSLIIGIGSMYLGRKVYCPMTVLYIPALLPMVPGRFAYNTVFAVIMSLQSIDDPEALDKYMSIMFSNGLVVVTVIFTLALGAMMPMILFPHKAFSLTRRRS